jgi:acetoin utilization deacetylase AcuC-like enzyme
MHAGRATEAPVEEAAPAAAEDLERVHPPEFLAGIRELCERGGGPIDLDTVVSERSYDAAVVASGAATAAVDAVLAGDLGAAFCLGRPPGHHAEAARRWASPGEPRSRRGGARGPRASSAWRCSTGTPTTATAPRPSSGGPGRALRLAPPVPVLSGDGSRAERGGGAGEGATVNILLAAGSSERGFMDAFEHEAPAGASRSSTRGS